MIALGNGSLLDAGGFLSFFFSDQRAGHDNNTSPDTHTHTHTHTQVRKEETHKMNLKTKKKMKKENYMFI